MDLMVACFIVALGATALLRLGVSCQHLATSNHYYVLANKIALTEIETIRATKGELLATCTDAPLISAPDLSALPSGRATLTITNSTTLTGAKDVVVTVTWTMTSSKQQSVTLKTMVGSDGATS